MDTTIVILSRPDTPLGEAVICVVEDTFLNSPEFEFLLKYGVWKILKIHKLKPITNMSEFVLNIGEME